MKNKNGGRDLLKDLTFDTDILEETLKSIISPETKIPAQVFGNTFENTTALLALPLVMLSVGFSDHYRTRSIFEAIKKSKNIGGVLKQGLLSKEFTDEVDRIYNEQYMDSSKKDSVYGASESLLFEMLDKPMMSEAIQVLIYYSLVSAWTAFESLSKDLWINTLNSRHNQLGAKALDELEEFDETPGISRKSISVKLLAKHGFDLRKNLGDLLCNKFDFTSLKGIANAYFAIFGKSNDLAKIFGDNNELENLEAVRHLVAHRAGYVDNEFITKTRMNLVVGKKILITADWTSSLLDSSIHAGDNLLRFVNSWLIDNPVETKNGPA